MSRQLHIIANCTDRKRRASEPLALRSIRDAPVRDRADLWWKALAADKRNVVPAESLYVGDHWATARQLPNDATEAGWKPTLWVASAGYGLVRADTLLRSYSATFGPGHQDSIANNQSGEEARDINRAWWKALSEKKSAQAGMARSIAKLAASSPLSRILVIASPGYLAAMRDDLLDAARALTNRTHLIIVSSSRLPNCQQLHKHWIQSDAKLQQDLGGSRISLNVRTGQKMIRESSKWDLKADILQKRYQKLVQGLPAPQGYNRTPMSDQEVKSFIKTALRQSPGTRHTSLLRQLRDGGQGCEQTRFRNLFREVSAQS